jgi:hypothetical protein
MSCTMRSAGAPLRIAISTAGPRGPILRRRGQLRLERGATFRFERSHASAVRQDPEARGLRRIVVGLDDTDETQAYRG